MANKKSNNKSIQTLQAEEKANSLESLHEIEAKKKEERILGHFKNQGYMLEWLEKNGSRWGGKVGKLLTKMKHGTIRPQVIKQAYALLHEGNKWDDENTEHLVRHLAEGHFQSFGENFQFMANALEDKDELTRKQVKKFLKRRTFPPNGETALCKEIIRRRKLNINPKDLKDQVKGAVDLLDDGASTREGAVEITEQVDLGILPECPERERFPEMVKRLSSYLEESTKRMDEMAEVMKESKSLAASKTALRAKIESDPDFAKGKLEGLMADYELLKRAAETLKKTNESPALIEALKEFDQARRSYSREQTPTVLKESETIHGQFLAAKEAAPAREALMKAAEDSIQNGLLETVLEVELERAVSTVAEDVVEGMVETPDEELKKAVKKIEDKYQIENPILDEALAQKAREKVTAYAEHEKQNVDSRSEYLDSSNRLNQWQGLCIDLKNHIQMVERSCGIKLTEKKDGLDIYPRQIELSYKKEDMKTLAERADQDEFSEDADPTGEFNKTPDGQAKYNRKKAKIVDIEYEPQSYDPSEKGAAEYKQDQAWRKNPPHKGILYLTIEYPGKSGLKMLDRMPHREFLNWVASEDVFEDIKDVEEVNSKAEEVLESKFDVKPGAVFLDQSEGEGDPQYSLVEVRKIENGIVYLETPDPKNPLIYRAEKELKYSSSIRVNQTAKQLPLGAFLGWVMRRNMVQIGEDSPKVNLDENSQPFWYEFGAGGDGEVRHLTKQGTLANTLKKYGGGAFGGGMMTPGQIAALESTPTFRENFLDANNRHIVREDIPAARLMQAQNKYALQNTETGEPAIEGMEVPQGLSPELMANQHISPEEKEALKEEIAEQQKALKNSDKGSRHFRSEALPKSATQAEGEAHRSERGYLKGLWRRTRVLSTDDWGGFFKTIYEHYERRWQRRSKEKYATVGKELPLGYGTEMNRIAQQAENEEVNQNMEAMEDWGVWEIQETLRTAGNKDQLKACFQTLVKKGHLRWDDVDMWRKINEYIPQGLMIPIPPGDNANFIDSKTQKTGFDYIEGAIDYLWGEGQYQGWHSENNSTYNQKFKQYWEKGKQLEGDPKNTGSIAGELKILLEKHKRGEYVDAHEYEGLVHFMIDYGKGSMEAKLYYIMEGVCIASPTTGATLMSFDRIGSINGDYLNRLPWMDYLVRRDVPRPDGTTTPWTIADFRKWCAEWDAGASGDDKNKPNQKVVDFIWENVLTDERTIIRNNKGLRNAQEMDHDDAHFILPLADEELMDNICQNSSGSRRYFTTEGYANGYPGYNQYLKTLAGNGEKAKVLNTIRGFARFNSIMSRRLYKDKNNYARIGPSFWKRPSVVDQRHTGWHRQQMEEAIERVAEAYSSDPGGAELVEMVKLMHTDTDSKEKEVQKKIEDAILDFGNKVQKVVTADGGRKMIAVINSSGLTGMPEHMSEEEKQRRQSMYSEDDELSKTFTDWGNEMN
jgi:hypothetical protein